MARKWSDVAASAAFQALSFEEQEEARRQYFEEVIAPQVPGEDVSSARDEFLADTAIRRGTGGGRGSINPPLVGQAQPRYPRPAEPAQDPVDYGQAANDMMGTPMSAPADQRGFIQRASDLLRPSTGSVLDKPASPEEQAWQRQAEIDRRLSYGAGPIRPEIVRAADDVRSARGTGTDIRFKNQSIADRVGTVVKEMDRRGESSTADVLASVNRPAIREAAAEAKAAEWRSLGEWAVDSLSGVAQGVVTLAQLPTNIIAPGSSLAESLRGTQKELQAAESDVSKASREVLRRRVETEDGFLGKYFATLNELVTNPTLAVNEGLKQIPMFIGVIGGARLGSSAAGAGVAAAGRVAPTVALADAIGGGALTLGARAAGATAGGVGASMVMAGGDAAGNTYETLTDRNRTPLSEWQKNPDFQKLVAEGKTEREAIQEIATAKARMAALITAPLGILGYMGAEAAVAGRGLGRAAADALTARGAAKLVARENITEQLEEGGTQLGSNILTSTIKQDQDLLEGVPQAMATAAVTSTPFGALGAYSQYRAAQQQAVVDPLVDATARANLNTANPSADFISPTQTVRSGLDVGPSAPARTDAGIIGGLTSFTPPDSITAQAGLAPIVVPTPGAAGASTQVGETNVGLPDVLGGLAGAGGVAGSGNPLGGLGGAGQDPAVAGGRGGDAAGALAGDGAAALGGVTGGQSGPSLTAGRGPRASDADLLARAEAASSAPAKIVWTGRAKTGYANEQDAEQAMATASAVIDTKQTHDWRVEPMENGRFQIVGYPKESGLATAVTGAAGQGLAGVPGAGNQQPAGAAGAGVVDLGQAVGGQPGVSGGAATVGSAAANEPTFTLKLAPRAPLRAAGQAITMLKSQRGVDVEIHAGGLTDQQKVASAMARLVGKTVTYLDYVAGKPEAMPNGFVIEGQGKNIYLDSNSDDGALFVMMHEGVHALPKPIREKLVTTIKGLTKTDMRGDFAQKFGYDANNEYRIDNEIAAFMTQAVTKRQDFWQELRTKMGDGDFAEVAKVILEKLNTFISGAKKEYGDDFLQRYATDAVAVRDAVSSAYAEAMQAQGLKPDVEVAGEVMASQRATTENAGAYSTAPDSLMGFRKSAPNKPFAEQSYKHVEFVRVTWPDGTSMLEAQRGLNKSHALERARRNWSDAEAVIAVPREVVGKEDPDLVRDVDSMMSGGAMFSSRAEQKNLAASNRSRIGLDFKDVIKRTPELQEGMARLQAGEITKEDYDRLVNEYKPVEPYRSVPDPVTPEAAKFALANGRGQSEEKAAKFGLPSQEMKAGEATQLRLDIPSYSEHGAWVVSVHRPDGRSFGAGKVVGYEPVASVKNAEFGMLEKSAAKIAAGANKGTIATIMGDWKPTTPAEAKLKADQALKSKDWVQVGMDPERHSYFYDRATMEPVTAADEVIQIGPLVLAKNPTYGKKSEFMFSQKARTPVKLADYKPDTDNFNKQQDMVRMLSEAVPAETVAKADEFVERYYKERQPVAVSPEDRLKAEILLRPKMKAAEQVKPEYDQKILDISARTSALGQMLAPIKGIKRAAEKLAVEENFEVDNIKDLLRSTIVVESYADAMPIVEEIRKEFDVVRIKDRAEAGVMGEGVTAAPRAKSGGYGDILINIRMPNGTIGEIQINTPAMLAAKNGQGHKLYEAAREQPEGSPLRQEIFGAMSVLYDAAFEAANLRAPSAQARNLASEMGAPRDGNEATEISSSPESASLKILPSGRATNSSPENEATNSEPGGKEAGTFIEGSPDKASISQQLSEPKAAGRYTYRTDKKGRIFVSGSIDRIRFLTRKLADGTVTDEGVRFKADDVKAVLKALSEEPTVNPEIARAIAEQLGLSPQELASTSLEYQTGEAKDRAFLAPIKGGIPEVVKFLEDRRRTSGLRLLDISNPQDQDTLAKLMAAETLAAIRSSGNALEWYDETIAKTLAMAAVKYPELADNANAQMAFRLAMAITSQGLNVENNLKFTMRQYEAYRKTINDKGVGKFPEVGEGDSSSVMEKSFGLINSLLDEMGPDLLRRFLVTEFTIGELNQAGFDPGGELVDEKVLGSSILGPKIGFGFYSNLNGNFEPVTMDMWFMRTIGRLTGNLRAFDAAKFASQGKRFRGALDERGQNGVFADRFDPDLVERARTDNNAAIELARQVKKAHEKDFKENRAAFDAGDREKSELVYAAATMIVSVDKPNDSPASGMERRLLREVVRKAVAEVERAHGQRIPPAAMQALIWYPEQELYSAMGVKLSVTSQDYAGATEKVLTEEGYDAERLRTAAQSGARRVRQANAGDVGQAAQGTRQGARQSGPLQAGERGDFLRARYERTELAKERLEPKRKGVVFEVAPDPNNEALTNAWRTLSAQQRQEISDRVARQIVPRVLAEFNTDGIITSQVGSYLDDTNPSFTLLLNKGDVVKVAKTLGFVLAQDSMMVVSPKEFEGGEQNSALVIEVGEKTPAQVAAIYKKLRQIKVKGEQVIGGQSYANGGMTVLNFSSVPTAQLAILVDQKLNKAYSILTRDVFAAFPEKKDYDYASEANDGRGSRALLRQRARDLRSEATSALEAELRSEGVQFSQRARSDAAGGGRDRGVGQEDVRGQETPSYGTPREGSSPAVGYHYSTQPRGTLSSGMYGTGLRGAEMQRLQGVDSRLKQRVYFYIDRGTGITPEAGVGGYAHRVNLQNLYDADEDALRLQRNAANFNAFESAVIDAGFDGYMVRQAGPSGNAVLLGQHAVPVEQLGSAGRMQTSDVVPAARERVLTDSEKIAANKSLPSGQVTGQQWAKMIKAMMPDVYERLADSPVWQSDQAMYRSELAKELRASASAPAFSNRALPKVSPQSALNEDIDGSAQNLSKAIANLRAGKPIPSRLVIGRLPHVLNMLGARTQEFDIASSIVKKIFVEKHEEDFGGVNVRDFVRAMYRPAMVLKSKDGAAREYELVLPITGDKGAVIVPIKASVDKTDPLGAVMSAYQKEVSAANNPKEMTVMRRVNEGNLLYVDPALAKQAVTGRKPGDERADVKLNDSFVSWGNVWPKLEKLIAERRVKTDTNLMGWIGNNYRPSSSPDGWRDAPSFSNRVGETPTIEDIPLAELRGRNITMPVRVEETGETGTLTVDASVMLEDINERESAMQRLLECLRK